MKNRILLFSACLLLATASLRAATLASTATSPDPASTAIFAGVEISSVDQLLDLTPKSYRKLTGKKMSVKDAISLKLMKHEIKKQMKREGSADLQTAMATSWSFNILAFLLGLLLSVIGVLLSLLFEDRRSALISSLIGLGVGILLFGGIFLFRG